MNLHFCLKSFYSLFEKVGRAFSIFRHFSAKLRLGNGRDRNHDHADILVSVLKAIQFVRNSSRRRAGTGSGRKRKETARALTSTRTPAENGAER